MSVSHEVGPVPSPQFHDCGKVHWAWPPGELAFSTAHRRSAEFEMVKTATANALLAMAAATSKQMEPKKRTPKKTLDRQAVRKVVKQLRTGKMQRALMRSCGAEFGVCADAVRKARIQREKAARMQKKGILSPRATRSQ